MKSLVLIKAFVLLLPLGWFILAGPNAFRVFSIGSIFALIELTRASSMRQTLRAWPIPLITGFYLIAGWIAPEVDEAVKSFDFSAAVGTMCYSIPAGFCFAHWSRKEPGAVLLGFVFFALALVIAANGLIKTVGIENILVLSENEITRVNPDSGFVFLGIFKPINVVIGIIPMTIFAVSSLPLLLLPGWKPQKILIVIASIGAIYANLSVATRTTLLAAALSFACIGPLLYFKGKIKRARVILILLVCIVSGAVFSKSLLISNLSNPVAERLQQIMDDGRFYIWMDSAKVLWNNPLGGGNGKLASELPWAHNLFLDFGLTHGWLGMASMLVLYGFIFYSVLRAIRKTNILTQPVGIVFLSVFLAMFFVAITEPPNSALIAFSYLTCCYCLASEKTIAKKLMKRAGISDLSDGSNGKKEISA